jgi:curved DNA-binding protein CbpA
LSFPLLSWIPLVYNCLLGKGTHAEALLFNDSTTVRHLNSSTTIMWTDAAVSNFCVNYNEYFDSHPSTPPPRLRRRRRPQPCSTAEDVIARTRSSKSHKSNNISNSTTNDSSQTKKTMQSLIRDWSPNKKNNSTLSSSNAAPLVNPYHVLQIRQDASPSEIRHSYRRLALWHHPGRSHDSLLERRQRLQVFETISASFETLIEKDSRRRYDLFLKGRFTAVLPIGELFVGGKLLVDSSVDGDKQHHRRGHSVDSFGTISTKSSGSNTLINCFDGPKTGDTRKRNELPALSRSSSLSSQSSISDEDENGDEYYLPQRLRVSVDLSDDEQVAEVHFTEAETNRLFGGPLAHLYRARRWNAFTDPFILFRGVFGSHIFGGFHPDQIQGPLEQWMPLRPTRNAAWMGSSRRLDDGVTTVFTTTRTLHDRRLTRTETVSIDPKTKRLHSVLTVTASDASSTTTKTARPLAQNKGLRQDPPDDDNSSLEAFLTCYVLSIFGPGEEVSGNNTAQVEDDSALCNVFDMLSPPALELCCT